MAKRLTLKDKIFKPFDDMQIAQRQQGIANELYAGLEVTIANHKLYLVWRNG